MPITLTFRKQYAGACSTLNKFEGCVGHRYGRHGEGRLERRQPIHQINVFLTNENHQFPLDLPYSTASAAFAEAAGFSPEPVNK